MNEKPHGGPSFVVLRDVSKRLGGVRAVDGVSLGIGRGEFFSLLGPSGSGKTTLMRMIAGFETPDAGSIEIDGVNMADVPPHQRPVNMMFQNYALFPHMSVAGNIAFGLKQQKLDRRTIAGRVGELLVLVQLEGLGLRRPHQLSGGQKQRVALARALARNPKVVLLDEPLAALDKKLRKETQAELKRIQAASGATFIVVTHDQDEAMALSDRMAIMKEGRIMQVDTPGTVYERPASRYVAGFVGEVNLFPATVSGLKDGLVLAAAEGIQGIVTLKGHDGGGSVSLALRPEHMRLSSTETPACDHWIPCMIEERAHLGASIAYRLRLPGGESLAALVASQGLEARFAVGHSAFVGFRSADAQLLGD